MARFVLLHSPLLGPASWRPTAEALRARGQVAETPAWPALAGLGGSFYPALADGMAGRLGAGEAPILVAHSGAGALVPALAARLEAVRGVIFADAILPHPGRSWFDTAPEDLGRQLRAAGRDGWLPVWDAWWPPGALERLVPDDGLRAALLGEIAPPPTGYFEEVAPDQPLELPAAYLKLSGAYEDEAEAATRLGWPVIRLPLDHLAPLTRPQPVAAALESLAVRLGG
ncbi:MAG TPA: hypothetical protein VLI41_09455 [Phenylobacterium sp.]|uniref:hypothetical protein n=1 Tax=Phenylobacterium sp. TaxID=1871053 RepID=UPI002CDF0A96|nr:hypothetical protein [Phenylobacterium sp.]HSV03419.1 hypothetical protein [Phenylobacterium sp.]